MTVLSFLRYFNHSKRVSKCFFRMINIVINVNPSEFPHMVRQFLKALTLHWCFYQLTNSVSKQNICCFFIQAHSYGVNLRVPDDLNWKCFSTFHFNKDLYCIRGNNMTVHLRLFRSTKNARDVRIK